jgi:hypothetical protein
MKTRTLVAASLTAVLFSAAARPVEAASYIVTHTGDSGPGSLRDAIVQANSGVCASPCAIVFNIAGAPSPGGVIVIQPLSPLPLITAANVTLDGGTQTAFAGDTNPLGPEVVIDGIHSGVFTQGFYSDAANTVIRDFVLHNFAPSGGSGSAIVLGSSAINNLVAGNYIGTDVTGTARVGNYAGVVVFGAGNQIGGLSPADRNVIGGNNTHGVNLSGAIAAGNLVIGNYLGTGADGITIVANVTSGVQISGGASGNTVGGTLPGASNLIRGNTQVGVIGWNAGPGNLVTGNVIALNHAGVSIIGSSTGVAVRQNAIGHNPGMGINLEPYGVNVNDPFDADEGPNGLQNYPVLTAATSAGLIEGTLHSTPASSFAIELFASPFCHAVGHGEGHEYLGTVAVMTDAAGDAAFAFMPTVPLPAGTSVAATAIEASGNTSEFSACLAVSAPALDTTPPVLHVTLSRVVLWPANGEFHEITASIAVSDDVDPAPAIGLVSIVSNDGPGGAERDIVDADLGQDDRVFALRAVRLGRVKAGRTYTVTYRATDASGNSALATATVLVPHDQRK